jgi:prepilin-type processing-associated H-X9-DG protein
MNTLWIDPSRMPAPLRCPAARKNTRQSWINQCAAYRYNAYAIGRSSASSRAMLFQDTCWPDWNALDFSHQKPSGLNIAYADGHVAFMNLASYLQINPDSNKEYQNQFFMQGWLE